IAPVWWHNAAHGAPLGITSSAAGVNFFIGNSAQATGTYNALREDRGSTEFEELDARALAEKEMNRPLLSGEVSRFWFRKSLRDIYAAPSHWCSLLVRKALLAVNRIELIDTDDIYYYEQYSLTLR